MIMNNRAASDYLYRTSKLGITQRMVRKDGQWMTVGRAERIEKEEWHEAQRKELTEEW